MRHTTVVAAALFLFTSGMFVGQVLRPPPQAPTVIVMPAAAPAAPAPIVESFLPPPPLPPVLPAMIWSSTVRAVSTQYSKGDWSAKRALGAPDVFPSNGDDVNAWASEGADDRTEFLELGLERAAHVSAVEVYETYNPGATSQIELISASGARIVVHRARGERLGSDSHLTRAEVGCTDEPIVAVRVTIDSKAVEGWNEIDAVGVQPCAK
jgi:hypothetical protein